jgi:hypothetical protein
MCADDAFCSQPARDLREAGETLICEARFPSPSRPDQV